MRCIPDFQNYFLFDRYWAYLLRDRVLQAQKKEQASYIASYIFLDSEMALKFLFLFSLFLMKNYHLAMIILTKYAKEALLLIVVVRLRLYFFRSFIQ